jgi:hypothetical protein
MTTNKHDDTPSIIDGRLVQLLDGEVDESERATLLDLVASDDAVRARFERLSATSAELTDGLGAEPVPPLPVMELPNSTQAPRRGLGALPGRWQAAAAALVLVSAGLTVEPVRAWLVEGASRIADMLVPQEAPTQTSAPVAEPVLPSTVSFLPGDGAVFVIDIEVAQETGVLHVEVAPDRRQVTASVVNGNGEALVVLPDGLRITNREGSTADYRISVPADLGPVQVRVEGQVVTTLDSTDPSGSWQVLLTR